MSDQSSDKPTSSDSQQGGQRAQRRRVIKAALATLPVVVTFTAGAASAQAQTGSAGVYTS